MILIPRSYRTSARFLDGPAQGVELTLRSCPILLRLVRGSSGWDALDQPNDAPVPGETVYVYQVVEGSWGQVFVRPGGRYEYGEYRYVPDAPTHRLRDRADWVRWARARLRP